MKDVLTGEVLKAVNCTRQDYNNWRKRIDFGQERYGGMTDARDGANYFPSLLIGFTTALVQADFEPSEAASRAEIYAVRYRDRGDFPKWLISYPGTEHEVHFGDKGAERSIEAAFEMQIPNPAQHWPDAVDAEPNLDGKFTVARIVNLAEVGARIDRLFSSEN